jgi:excisionase family DNA binding protein
MEIEMKKKKLLSISQMAKRLGITRQAVRKAIVEKRLKYRAYKIGAQWVVEVPA